MRPTKTRLANAFWAVSSARDLINPGHTCRLYLPHEIQQTSSLALLILQAIMIFCGGWLLMPFCWLCTQSEANCVFTPLGSERSAAPADSVIPGLRVCRHVSAAAEVSTSLTSLHSGRHIPRPYQRSAAQIPASSVPVCAGCCHDGANGGVHWKETASALRWPNSGLCCLRKKMHEGNISF